MPVYTVQCSTGSTADITLSASGYVTCPAGTLQVVEQSPSVASLDLDDIDYLTGSIVVMSFTAYGIGLLVRTGWHLFVNHFISPKD